MQSLQNRLKSSKEIEYVFSRGSSAKSGFLFLKYIKNNSQNTRFAISIGKKFSKLATKRNRAKRVVRKVIGKILPVCKTGYDVVIFFKHQDDQKKRFETEVVKELLAALKKAKIC